MAQTVTTRAVLALCLAAVLQSGVWLAPSGRPVRTLRGSQSLRPQAVAAAREPRSGDGGSALLRTVPLTAPTMLAVDERVGHVFVTCGACLRSGAGAVSMLDARTGALLRTVPVGRFPFALAVDALRSRIFLTTNQGVSVLDAQTDRVVRTVAVPGGANWIAIAEKAGHVFVTATAARVGRPVTLYMLNARSGQIQKTLNVGPDSFVQAVAQTTGLVFVVHRAAQTMTLLRADTGGVIRTFRFNSGQSDTMALAEHLGHAFVANTDASTVSMLAIRTGLTLHTTPVDSGPSAIGVDSVTARVFVCNNPIDVLDARTGVLLSRTAVAELPVSLPVAFSPAGAVAVVLRSPRSESDESITGPGRLLILDGKTGAVRRRLDVGPVEPFGATQFVGVDERTHRLFVLNGQGVDVFDTTRL